VSGQCGRTAAGKAAGYSVSRRGRSPQPEKSAVRRAVPPFVSCLISLLRRGSFNTSVTIRRQDRKGRLETQITRRIARNTQTAIELRLCLLLHVGNPRLQIKRVRDL